MRNAPAKVAACARCVGLILESPCRRELAHDPLLLLREFLRSFDLDLDDEISGLGALVNPLAANPETFPRSRSGWNPDDDFLSIESVHAHLRAERRLSDVQRKVCDDIQSLSLV